MKLKLTRMRKKAGRLKRRLLQWFEKNLARKAPGLLLELFPPAVIIEPTNICNPRCPLCPTFQSSLFEKSSELQGFIRCGVVRSTTWVMYWSSWMKRSFELHNNSWFNLSIIQKVKIYPGALLWAILGFIFFAVACYPGFMSPDSLSQYRQAQTLKFSDWHPPVMAWLWSKLNMFMDGPQSLLFLHLCLLWGGLYVWRRNAGESRMANLFILVGFFPWVANFQGVLWKDVGMAFSLLLALGLLSGKELTKKKTLAVVFLLMYAFMVRGNAPAALAPIVWYAYAQLFPLLASRVRIAATILTLVSMFAFSNFFNYRIANAEKSHLTMHIMIDDLVHLSVVTDRSVVPMVDFETVKECSQEMISDTKLVGRVYCLRNRPSYQKVAPIPYEEVKKAWVSAVANNPLEYLKFRLDAYLYLLRSPFEKPFDYNHASISPNDMGLTHENNPATTIQRVYVGVLARLAPFLFKPYWWLIVALLFLWATFATRGDRGSLLLIRVLLTSAILYMLSYILLTPAADFRYVYWSTLAISLAVITFTTSNLKLDMSAVRAKVECLLMVWNKWAKTSNAKHF